MKKMSEMREAVEARQMTIEVTVRDSLSKVDTIQESALKHARLTNETMNKEVSRFEKVVSTFEQFTKSQISDLKKQIETMNVDYGKWQINFEDVVQNSHCKFNGDLKKSFPVEIQRDQFHLLCCTSPESHSQFHRQPLEIKEVLWKHNLNL